MSCSYFPINVALVLLLSFDVLVLYCYPQPFSFPAAGLSLTLPTDFFPAHCKRLNPANGVHGTIHVCIGNADNFSSSHALMCLHNGEVCSYFWWHPSRALRV